MHIIALVYLKMKLIILIQVGLRDFLSSRAGILKYAPQSNFSKYSFFYYVIHMVYDSNCSNQDLWQDLHLALLISMLRAFHNKQQEKSATVNLWN